MKLQKFTRTVPLLVATFLVMILVFSIVVSSKHWNKTKNITNNNENLSPKAKTMLSHLPLTFIENQGQWNTNTQYVAKKRDMSIQFEKDGFILNRKKSNDNQVKTVAIRMTFEGASEQVMLKGTQKQTAKYNYFLSNNQSKWRKNVTGYAQLIYHNLYQGIDLCFYEKSNGLEYDLILSPGADLNNIKIRCEGLKELKIDENGILVMETEFGPITQSPPKAWYKQVSGENLPVVCNFRKINENTYGFQVLESNSELALVIDPGLEWSTFLGHDLIEYVNDMALNTSGNLVVAGFTESDSFPIVGGAGAYDTIFNGGTNDAFVSCLSADGSQLLWTTFLGGSNDDVIFDLCLDNADSITVTGLTFSDDFPITSGVYDSSYNGGCDAIVARLTGDGNQLVYSTFLGDTADEWALALDIDNTGNAVVGGYTMSPDFPITPGAYDSTFDFSEAFVTRLSADGSSLDWSTFLGGSYYEGGWTYSQAYPVLVNLDEMALMVDPSGEVIVCGLTGSEDFSTTFGAYDTSFNGSGDIFLTRLNASGNGLIYSTFFGGSGYDRPIVNGLLIEPSNNILLTGYTGSDNLPMTPGAFATRLSGIADGFVARFNETASNLLYSTYIGGPSEVWECATDVTIDVAGNVVVTGACADGFPITSGAYDTIFNGGQDVFVSRLNLGGNGQEDLLYSTYIGGYSHEGGIRIILLADSTVLIAGRTLSSDFPSCGNVFDPTFNGSADGFILRFGAYVGIQEPNITRSQSSITLSPVYPNPVHNNFCCELNLTQATQVKVSLFDITGRMIETLVDKQLSAGVHNLTWTSKQSLANGVYYLRLDAENKQQSRKFIVMK